MKTNVMRILEQAGVAYVPHEYDPSVDKGEDVARLVGKSAGETFKTLVTESDRGECFVFVIPVCCTLDLKKAARAAGVKSVEMLPQKKLLPMTGYVHGGCSPIGMKKPFPTYIDETAVLFDTICVSGGRRGYQIEVSPSALAGLVFASFSDLTADR